MVMMPTKEQLRQLDRDNAMYPIAPTQIPINEWPSFPGKSLPIEVWRSRAFLIQVFQEHDGALRMSVNRTTFDCALGRWAENITWDDLQKLKQCIGRGHLDAVEIYPADCDIVNIANMRHLWILDKPYHLAWRKNGDRNVGQ